MAAYWRSPYREPSNSFKNANHSTWRFERSLHLSRAKTTINASNYDWFDATTPRSVVDKTFDKPQLTRSSTTIKSILKSPRRECNNRARVKDLETDALEECRKENRKRVTFGLSNTLGENEPDEEPSVNSRNHKCPLTTLKRISYSKLVEESALRKLNRLIGGEGYNTPLPAVKGKGLSPRPTTDTATRPSVRPSGDTPPKPPGLSCSHSQELRCVKCIRKDSDSDDLALCQERSDTGVDALDTENEDRLPKISDVGDDGEKEERKEVLNTDYCSERIDENITRERTLDFKEKTPGETLTLGKEEFRLRHKHPHVVPHTSLNAKKYFRLLPGRYPFTTGAMQIKKLSVPGDQTEGSKDPAIAKQEADVTDVCVKDNSNSTNKRSEDKSNSPRRRKVSAGTDGKAHPQSSLKITTIAPSPSLAPEPCKSTGPRTGQQGDWSLRREATLQDDGLVATDKTSHILNWLHDVHQKQTFKPRLLTTPS